MKAEYVELQRKDRQPRRAENLYHDGPLLPCLFNSGCGIGRHGITAIEVVARRVALVYWFDRRRSAKYFESEGYKPQQTRRQRLLSRGSEGRGSRLYFHPHQFTKLGQ